MGILRAAPDLLSRLPVRRAATGLGPDPARRLLEALIAQFVPGPSADENAQEPLPVLLVPNPVGALAAAACGLAAREADALAPDAATALATALAAGARKGKLLEHLHHHHGDVTAAAQACWSRAPNVLAPGHAPGAHVPRAVGVARAMRLQARPSCVLTLLPSNLVREPDVHNGLNFAAVCRAPVVFVTRPGRVGSGGPGGAGHPGRGQIPGSSGEDEPPRPGMAATAVSYGIPAERVAASSPLAVWAAIEEATDSARAGQGPALVDLVEDRGPPLALERLLEDLAAAAGWGAREQTSLRRAAAMAWRAARSNPRPS